MNRLLKSALLAATFLTIAAAPPVKGVGVGDKPKLMFVDAVSNKKISLADMKGKVVVIDFWATWCGPCMAEAEHMVGLNKKYADKGVKFIGISLDQKKPQMLKVVKESGFAWPHQYDGKGWKNAVATAWGVNSIPRTFILDGSGEVIWTGHSAKIDEPLEEAVKKLGEAAPSAPAAEGTPPATQPAN